MPSIRSSTVTELLRPKRLQRLSEQDIEACRGPDQHYDRSGYSDTRKRQQRIELPSDIHHKSSNGPRQRYGKAGTDNDAAIARLSGATAVSVIAETKASLPH